MTLLVVGLLVSGLIYGSFLNVVIARANRPDWLSILIGRSRCPKCHETLRWFELIPVVSYIFLRGRCRHCGKPISSHYVIVELLAGLFAIFSYLFLIHQGLSFPQCTVKYILFNLIFGLLLVILINDLEEMAIPDWPVYGLFFLGLLNLELTYTDLWHSLLGLAVGFLIIALIVYPSRGHWMGEGDVKLAAALGLLTGWPGVLVFLAIAFLLGGVFAIVALISGQAKLKTAVPFAPFLVLGALVSLFYSSNLVSWYLKLIGQ